MDISSAGRRSAKGTVGCTDILTHLRVVLESAVIDARGQTDCNQTPVRKVDGSEWRDILSLEPLDAVDAVADYEVLVSDGLFRRETPLTVRQAGDGIEKLGNVMGDKVILKEGQPRMSRCRQDQPTSSQKLVQVSGQSPQDIGSLMRNLLHVALLTNVLPEATRRRLPVRPREPSLAHAIHFSAVRKLVSGCSERPNACARYA